MATLTHLPDVVIATILENKNISMEDIMNLKSTCKRFQNITFFAKFWEKKFFQRFPLSKRINDKKTLKKNINHVAASLKCIEEVWHYVSLMSYNNIQDMKKMELTGLLRSIAEHSTIYRFVLDDINRIISQLSCHDSNLTVKYYFDLIYHWLRQYRLAYKQIKFIHMPKEKQLLEKQITNIAQYFQPNVSYSIIDTWLDDIVQEVLSCLANKYPTHSIFTTSFDQFNLWRNNNINDDFWNPTETDEIMRVLQEIIFSKFGVHQLQQLFVTLELEEYKNHVSFYKENLLPIIYTSIARRLGVCCFLNYKYNFRMSIKWKLNSSTDYRHQIRYFYNAVPYSWRTERITDCVTYPLYNLIQIQKLIFELYQLIISCDDPELLEASYKWKMMYMLILLLRSLGDNIGDIDRDNEYIYITRSIKNGCNIATNEPLKIRKKEIKFTIGMIVKYSSNFCWDSCDLNNQDGVIIGWHYKCENAFVHENLNSLVPLLSECYQTLHSEYSCKVRTCGSEKSKFIHQPHYIILTNDNRICYLPQGKLSKCSPNRVNNEEIGRYFTKFEGNYYVPNENLARNYPADIAVLHKIFSN